jgi:fucose 4-O-acetylase-like acetyltransferase
MKTEKKIKVISISMYILGGLFIFLNLLNFIPPTEGVEMAAVARGLIAGAIFVFLGYVVSYKRTRTNYWWVVVILGFYAFRIIVGGSLMIWASTNIDLSGEMKIMTALAIIYAIILLPSFVLLIMSDVRKQFLINQGETVKTIN